MAKNKMTEIVSTIVDALSPLSSEERLRIVRASLALLGEAKVGVEDATTEVSHGVNERGLFPVRAQTWMKQNNVSPKELEQVFHVSDGDAEVIVAEIPGKNKREKTLNAYALTGIAKLLAKGDVKFDDKSARSLCESTACYDKANHSVILKNKGNKFAGTKQKGWTLTAPGLKHGAALVRELSK